RGLELPLLRHVLDFSGGNQLKAARLLGINRNTLRKRLRVLGLLPQPSAGNAPPGSPARCGPAAGRGVPSVFVRARSSTRTVLGPAVLLLVALSGCAGLPSEPIPGAPAHPARGGDRQTGAGFHH